MYFFFQEKDNDGMKDTTYYQWVPFFFMINAIIFLIPNQIWKAVEGGFVKGFILEENQTKYVMKNINKSPKVPAVIEDGNGGKIINPASLSNPNNPISEPASHIDANLLK